MTKTISIPDRDYLPPELLLDVHHPANSEYMQNINSVKRTVVACSSKMKAWHVDAVKRRVAGAPNTEIATVLNKSDGAVSQALNRQDAKELRALLEHYNMAMDGPNDAHRRRMLWEIAVDNQDIEPKVSISSVAEINKMNQTYATGSKDTAINITINNTLLPKGKLDT